MNKQERQTRMQEMDGAIRLCVKCLLHESRTVAVPGEGPVPCDLFILGEAPGAQEDKQGRPFVGASGVILDQLLEVAGLSRRDAYITSCVKCRPPQNRTPHILELDTCQENWLNRQLDLVHPKIVVLLGKVAISRLLHDAGSLREFHGRTVERDGRLYLMTYHPAAVFRVPEIKDSMKADMAALQQLLVGV